MSIPDIRLRYLSARIHALGPRPLYELFRALDAGRSLSEALEDFAEIDPGLVIELGADKFLEPFAIDGGTSKVEAP